MSASGEDTSSRFNLGEVAVQVKALERAYEDIGRSIRDQGSKFESALASLATKVEQRAVTQWPTIFAGGTIMLTVLGSLIMLLAGPIQRDTSRLDTAVAAILERGVFQRGYDADQLRTADAVRALRADLNITVQQQRYNTDQERLIHTLDEVRANVEQLRVRSYDNHGRIARNEQAQTDIDRRVDAISRRLAEFIRDAGKH